MSLTAPVEIEMTSTVDGLRLQIAKLRAALEACIDERRGLFVLGMSIAKVQGNAENTFIEKSDIILDIAAAVLAETESP